MFLTFLYIQWVIATCKIDVSKQLYRSYILDSGQLTQQLYFKDKKHLISSSCRKMK
jgi:hypothetical protein